MNLFKNCLAHSNYYDNSRSESTNSLYFTTPEKASIYNLRRSFKIHDGFMRNMKNGKKPVTQFSILLPHTFLYIFDKENKEFPKEIVNLTYYEKFEKNATNPTQFFLKSQKYNGLPTLHFEVDYEEDLNDWKNYIENGNYLKLSNLQQKYKNVIFINNTLLGICCKYLNTDIFEELHSLMELQKSEMNFPEYNLNTVSNHIRKTVNEYEEKITRSIETIQQEKSKNILTEKRNHKEKIQVEEEKNKKLEMEISKLKDEKILLAKELKKSYKKIAKQKYIITTLARFLENWKQSK